MLNEFVTSGRRRCSHWSWSASRDAGLSHRGLRRGRSADSRPGPVSRSPGSRRLRSSVSVPGFPPVREAIFTSPLIQFIGWAPATFLTSAGLVECRKGGWVGSSFPRAGRHRRGSQRAGHTALGDYATRAPWLLQNLPGRFVIAHHDRDVGQLAESPTACRQEMSPGAISNSVRCKLPLFADR